MHPAVREIEKTALKDKTPDFNVGDTVRVEVEIVEGDRTRTQPFEGVVIARKGAGPRETFTLRRIASGVGVERTFPLHSPRLAGLKVVRRGKVRRSKLYYLRRKVGKKARVKEGRIRRAGTEAEKEKTPEDEAPPEETT
ncbi:MAG: 50S ribosomal protein L19 [candidate division Zixibacteria bacterium]|nr:50S ribosomal protein L19 [candidate division Zixibacteria bacterium]